jgi:ribosomal protein L34E
VNRARGKGRPTMSRAMKCDHCGEFSEAFSLQPQASVELLGVAKFREDTKGVRVILRAEPINAPSNPYGGLDLCHECLGDVLIAAIRKLYPESSVRKRR